MRLFRGSSSANGKRDTIEKRLQSYGMIPELIGRISDFISLEKLTKEDYVQVLTNTKENALKGIRELYEAEDHINIDVSDEAIEAIAEKAVKQELGARQMANILERAVRNEVYWAMERGITDVLITRENISEN